jgi:hypothetical protein
MEHMADDVVSRTHIVTPRPLRESAKQSSKPGQSRR